MFPAAPAGGQRNPVLWPRRFFPKLMFLSGAEGAKRLLRSVVSETISVTADDPAVFADVDTSADLEAARALLIRPRATPRERNRRFQSLRRSYGVNSQQTYVFRIPR